MTQRLRIPLACVAALGLTLGVATPATADLPAAHATSALPTEFPLPNGFAPEGIAIGALPFAFFGSRDNGDLFRVNLLTGEGALFSRGNGTQSVGMKVDRRGRLFVAGGTGGGARVVDTHTGTVLASYTFATAPTFVNDVVLTPDAAWFTDSLRPLLYKVPLGRHGALPAPATVVTIPLTGDGVDQPAFNNGISRAPDGKGLLIVQTGTGLLFRIDPATGFATRVDLGGQLVGNGDGILLEGRILYVVQNRDNRVAVIRLNSPGTSGTVTQLLTDPRFDTPTTVASFGGRLYLPNARINILPPQPTTPYNAVAVRKPCPVLSTGEGRHG